MPCFSLSWCFHIISVCVEIDTSLFTLYEVFSVANFSLQVSVPTTTKAYHSNIESTLAIYNKQDTQNGINRF